MKIVICNSAARKGGGITYLKSIVEALLKVEYENCYIIYLSIHSTELFKEFSGNERLEARTNFLLRFGVIGRLVFEQIALPFILRREKADLLYCPANIGTFFRAIPTVITIQQIKMYKANSWLPLSRSNLRNKMLSFATSLSIKKADQVTFISKYAENEARKRMEIPTEKTCVIYNGVESIFHPGAGKNKETRNDINFNTLYYNYIAVVSSLTEHKNIEKLIEAYDILRKGSEPPILLIAGDYCEKSYYDKLKNLIEKKKLGSKIKLLGHIAYENLPSLYSNALLFILPSLEEAFGLPLVEAMSCGVPVLSSNVAALPEIAEDAAIYFSPYSKEEMADGMRLLIDDEELRRTLSERGLERAKKFSWEIAAGQLLFTFHKAINSMNQQCEK